MGSTKVNGSKKFKGKRVGTNMEVIITRDYQAMAQRCARLMVEKIMSTSNEGKVVLGLPTGRTPESVYEELVKMYQNGDVDFQHAITFNLDEYSGLSPEDARSYNYYMWEKFFSHVNVPKENINIPNGTAPDLEEECRNYDRRYRETGGVDLMLLGIGRNGHIAFNEPGTPFGLTTHLVKLAEQTLLDNFGSTEDDTLPRYAFTMGIKSIMKSREIILIATGENKAEIMPHALQGPVSEKVPASVLQLHPNVKVILDEEAAAQVEPGKVQ